jgi:hypothetical protein
VESQIKRYGGCFLGFTLLCPEIQESGKFLCTSLCKAELAESQISFGGWGVEFINAVNKCLKMLGFFPKYETISHGLCLPISQVVNLLTALIF